ncbi:MAG: hypothetical protein HY023_06400 [Chloroflexi bacterium]|nr:hypothetical protein [Chloroflexota bacterium]
MALLDDLLCRLRAEPILSDIRVIETEAVDDETFHFKIRAVVKPLNLQIRFLSDKSFKRYSFQLYGDRPLMRWDNTPHYPNLPNFPHHFHDADNQVSSSPLTGDLLSDVEIVLTEVTHFVNSITTDATP